MVTFRKKIIVDRIRNILYDFLMKKKGKKSKFEVNITELAKEIGITREYLQNIVGGGQKCSIKTALKIQEVSKGKIKVTDFMPEAKEIAIRILAGS